MDDTKTKELMVKCESMKDDPALIKQCKDMMDTISNKNVEIEGNPDQNYTNMAENISSEYVPKAMKMALKIAK